MRRIRRACALFIALILLLGLTACGSGEPSFEEVMANAVTELGKLKSMHSDTSMDITMSVNDQQVSTTMSMLMDTTIVPMAAKGEMTAKIFGMTVNAAIYMEQSGDTYTTYTSTDGGGWIAQDGLQMPDVSQYTPAAVLQMYLSGSERFEKMGTETVNGYQAVRYDGSIAMESIGDVLEASGMAEQFSAYGLDTDQVLAMYDDAGDIKMSVWIDEASGLPIRYDMDMTDMMNTVMGKLTKELLGDAPGFTLGIDRAEITMLLSQFNAIDPIVVPDEVKNIAV